MEAKAANLLVKVVERAGRKLRHQVPGLQCTVECSNQQCFLHQKGGKGDCHCEGCVYRGSCLTCEARGLKTRLEVDRDREVTIVEVEERAPPARSGQGDLLQLCCRQRRGGRRGGGVDKEKEGGEVEVATGPDSRARKQNLPRIF